MGRSRIHRRAGADWRGAHFPFWVSACRSKKDRGTDYWRSHAHWAQGLSRLTGREQETHPSTA
jgi:hypothetical protein